MYSSYEQEQHVSLTMAQLSVPSSVCKEALCPLSAADSASAVGHQPQGLRASLQQHAYMLFCNNSPHSPVSCTPPTSCALFIYMLDVELDAVTLRCGPYV